MTASPVAAGEPRIVPWSRRVLNGVRIHAANPWPSLVLPWFILAAVFGLTYSIWRIVAWAAGDGPLDADAFHYGGGVSWILFYMIAVASQAMNQTFRFATSLASTRRDYYLGTCGFFLGLALLYSGGIGVLAAVERATGGWGLDGAFFAPAFLIGAPLWEVVWFFFGLMVLMLSIGAAVGAVFLRWRGTGLVMFFLALGLLVVVALYGITAAGAWGTVGEYLAETPLALQVASTLPVAGVAAAVGYLLLRRASVKP